MIKINVKKDKGRYFGFTCKGHAEYAEYGSDIVCSAISILVINTINSIESFTDCSLSVSDEEKTGEIRVEFPDGSDEKASLLMDAMLICIRSVEEQYGESFVKLKI